MTEHICKAKSIENGEWVYGYYVVYHDYLEDERAIHVIYKQDALLYPMGDSDKWDCVIPDTVCRCTGVKDKNGKLIFENDYVRTEFGRICKVNWFSSRAHNGWDLTPVARLDCPAPCGWSVWDGKNLEVCDSTK